MIFPLKTTRKERITISNNMWPIFSELEHAQVLLETCLDDNFSDTEQKSLHESQAEWLGNMLYLVNTALLDAISSFKLITGLKHGTEWIEGAMTAHNQALAVDAAHNKLSDLWRKIPVEKRKAIEDARAPIDSMDDKTALPELQKLIERTEAIYLQAGQES